jgi:HEAT repeat protein
MDKTNFLKNPPGISDIKASNAVPLMNVLLDYENDVREAAEWALGRIKSERAAESSEDTKNDADKYIYRYAAWALDKIDDKKVLESLVTALRDEDLDVRSAALKVLLRIGKPAVELLFRVLKDDDTDIRAAALKVFQSLDNPAVKPPG